MAKPKIVANPMRQFFSAMQNGIAGTAMRARNHPEKTPTHPVARKPTSATKREPETQNLHNETDGISVW